MKLTNYIANFITKRTKHAFVGNGGSVVHILDSFKDSMNVNPVRMCGRICSMALLILLFQSLYDVCIRNLK